MKLKSPTAEKDSRQMVTIRFHAPFGGRDNWKVEIPVNPGETVPDLFSRLEKDVYRELKEKILDPPVPRFAVSLDGVILSREKLSQVQLKGSEQITVLALLVGG